MPTYLSDNKSKEKAQRLRRLRMHVSQTSWLDEPPALKDGQINFKDHTLTSTLISKTQRSLTHIRKSKKLAAELLGNVESWLDAMADRLSVFKRLNAIKLDRIETEITRAAGGKSFDSHKILPILELEYNCLTEITPNPIKLLTKYPEQFQEALVNFISDFENSTGATALACLYLGILDRQNIQNSSDKLEKIHAISGVSMEKRIRKWYRHCYQYGKENKSAVHAPSLIVDLLYLSGDKKQIADLASNLDKENRFSLSERELRILLWYDMPVADLALMLNRLPKLEVSFKQLSSPQVQIEKDKGSLKKQIKQKAEFEVRHQKLLDQASYMIRAWLRGSLQGDSPLLIASLIDNLSSLGTANDSNLEEVFYLLKKALTLTAPLRVPWLSLIKDNLDLFYSQEERKQPLGKALKRRRPGPRTIINTSIKILELTDDPTMTLEILDFWIGEDLLAQEISDREMIKLILAWCKKLKVTRAFSLADLIGTVATFRDAAEARAVLTPFVDIVAAIPEQHREHAFSNLTQVLACTHNKGRKDFSPELLELLPPLLEATTADNAQSCPCWTMLHTALVIDKRVKTKKKEFLDTLFQFYKTKQPLSSDQISALDDASQLGLTLMEALESGTCEIDLLKAKGLEKSLEKSLEKHPEGSPEKIFKRILESYTELFKREEYQYCDFENDGIKFICDNPFLINVLLETLLTNAKRAKSFVKDLGLIKRFNQDTKRPVLKLESLANLELTEASLISMVESGWQSVMDLLPDMRILILNYMIARGVAGADPGPPPSVRKTLSLKERLKEEKRYLEQESDKSADVSTRIKNLEKRLEDEDSIQQNIKTSLRRQLIQISREAEIDALNKVIFETYRNQLKSISAGLSEKKEITFDSYLKNALLLTQDIEYNKRLLKKLIKASVEKDYSFRHKVPGNEKFIKALVGKGIDSEAWLGANPQNYTTTHVPGKRVHVRLETDPLKVLEMGNYFDTCLSFGDFNSFSTVANATDLNKRVLYAIDQRDNVIGRKLIAINTDFELVGFRTYTSVETREGRNELRKIILDYIRDFSKSLGLSLSSTGEVAILACENWYNDGLVSWSSEPKARSRETKGSQRLSGSQCSRTQS